jgi:hypothetical protein
MPFHSGVKPLEGAVGPLEGGFEPLEVVLNVAVTVEFPERVKEQEPVPLQVPPLHPANVEPDAGVSVQVIVVSEA